MCLPELFVFIFYHNFSDTVLYGIRKEFASVIDMSNATTNTNRASTAPGRSRGLPVKSNTNRKKIPIRPKTARNDRSKVTSKYLKNPHRIPTVGQVHTRPITPKRFRQLRQLNKKLHPSETSRSVRYVNAKTQEFIDEQNRKQVGGLDFAAFGLKNSKTARLAKKHNRAKARMSKSKTQPNLFALQSNSPSPPDELDEPEQFLKDLCQEYQLQWEYVLQNFDSKYVEMISDLTRKKDKRAQHDKMKRKLLSKLKRRNQNTTQKWRYGVAKAQAIATLRRRYQFNDDSFMDSKSKSKKRETLHIHKKNLGKETIRDSRVPDILIENSMKFLDEQPVPSAEKSRSIDSMRNDFQAFNINSKFIPQFLPRKLNNETDSIDATVRFTQMNPLKDMIISDGKNTDNTTKSGDIEDLKNETSNPKLLTQESIGNNRLEQKIARSSLPVKTIALENNNNVDTEEQNLGKRESYKLAMERHSVGKYRRRNRRTDSRTMSNDTVVKTRNNIFLTQNELNRTRKVFVDRSDTFLGNRVTKRRKSKFRYSSTQTKKLKKVKF